MKSILHLLCLLFLTTTSLFGQWPHLYQINSDSLDISFYKPNPKTTVYDPIHTLFGAMEPISYFHGVGNYNKKFLNPSVDPYDSNSTPSKDSLEKSILEINFYIPLTLLRGRGQSDNWKQAARLTFDYWAHLRVSKTNSSPILPPTNAYGFSFDFSPFDNFRGGGFWGPSNIPKEDNFDKRNFWEEHNKPTFEAVTLQAKFMHYSNGQAPGFFFPGDSINHDYTGGDFSTNFLQFMAGYHKAYRTGRILSAWGGYRVDFEFIPGLFMFSKEQKKSYGQQRLLLNLQWVTKPKKFRMRRNFYDVYNHNEDGDRKKYDLRDLWNFQFRTEMVYIAGNLNNWRKVGKDGHKYRFGIKQIMKINFLRNRNFGATVIYYYGRDYLNIRFDNVVSIWSAGLNFKFNKNPIIAVPKTYTPLNFKEKKN